MAICSKERPNLAMAGYACQNPCLPRKSGNPESTPMPAPAVTNSASAAWMAADACFTLSSMFMQLKSGTLLKMCHRWRIANQKLV